MKILDEANAELCRHRDLALTAYARRLLAAGADIDGEEFRADLRKYAVELEAWRSKAMDRLRQFVEAMTERPSATLH
ncbi:hypothetical protein IVB08_16865 [Bradyrhizobium sp. 173]|uniref:hypothetical protein n=1 Tax=Bradyrhizobium sp. 173 TaxID=2782644 RepID=UPI001FFBB7AF|nr:hypothetical protein [Bradyrhizobium sp. 173]MCK1565614.1 hypothetical protein [Bradyrhizobium sp. 173]